MRLVKIPLCLEMICFLSSLSNTEPVHPIPTSSSFVFVCTDGRDMLRVLTKAWKYLTWGNPTFREFEFVFPLSDPFTLFPKFWVHFKALNVLCWMISEKPPVGFPPVLWKVFSTSIQTLWTSSFASLSVTFFAYFELVIKISKGFRKWNCFRKTGLNTNLIVSIVATETSVTKVMSRVQVQICTHVKYKFHVLKWKMLTIRLFEIYFKGFYADCN